MTARRRPGRPPGGGRLVDRDEMLDAAERALGRHGPGVSMDAIAEEAGVTKPVLYDRVGGRGDLADALAARLAAAIITEGGRVLPRHRPIDREEFVLVCTAVLETLAARRGVFGYVLQVGSEDVVGRTVALVSRSAEPLEALLGQHLCAAIDPARRRTWAHAIVGMLNVVGLWWIASPERRAHEVAEDLVALVWPGLVAESTVEPTGR